MKILVTGGTDGIGKGVAKHLAGLKNEIIILCRNKEKGEKTIKEIEAETKNTQVSFVLCDLTKLGDVKNVLDNIHEKHNYLDVLFINAGLGYTKSRIETEDNMERVFQVNYLSQFMLTLNLLDLLEKSENGGRVIFNATTYGKMNWDDMQQRKKWGFEQSITQAMVCKRMFMLQLHTACRKKKYSKLSFIAVNLKTVWTNQINLLPFFMKMLAYLFVYPFSITTEKCAENFSTLFVESQENSLKRSGKLIQNGTYKEKKEIDDVLDEKKREKLWKISLDLCKDDKTNQISEELLMD